MELHKIVWPWECSTWRDIIEILDKDINSILQLDSIISAIHNITTVGKLRPRTITDLFTTIYTNHAQALPNGEYLVNSVLPNIQKLIIRAPDIFRGVNVYLLTRVHIGRIVLNRIQVASLCACILFGVFSKNKYIPAGLASLEEFSQLSFVPAFMDQNVFVVRCMLLYFCKINKYLDYYFNPRNGDNGVGNTTSDDTNDNVNDTNSDDTNDNVNDTTSDTTNDNISDTTAAFIKGLIVLERVRDMNDIDWANSKLPITEIYIGEGRQDETPISAQIISSGALLGEYIGAPLTQESITLLTRPETLIAPLFCSRMTSRDSIIVYGAEKITAVGGFGSDVSAVGYYDDNDAVVLHGGKNMIPTAMIFLDAAGGNPGRDLQKAFIGINGVRTGPNSQIAGGNWNCKQCHDMQLKFIQQLLAASMARKCLVYYPIGRDFEEDLIPFIEWIHATKPTITIGELFLSLCN